MRRLPTSNKCNTNNSSWPQQRIKRKCSSIEAASRASQASRACQKES